MSFLLNGQNVDRLVILADNRTENPAIDAQVLNLRTDFTLFFHVTDIQVISVASSAVQPAGENTVTSIAAGLQRTAQLCRSPQQTTVVAFLFSDHDGPSLDEISETLQQVTSEVKILSTSYFRSQLADLSCGRHTVFDYSRGAVRPGDTILTDEKGFPIIPVGVGIAGAGTGIYLLTRDKNADCDPVDASWQAPNGLCLDGTPVILLATGTAGGDWSGTGVTQSGVFNPASGSQSITYSVGQGDCRQSQSHTIEVISVDAAWTASSQPCAGETITLIPVLTGGTWSGPGVVQNPDGTASFMQSGAGTYVATYSVLQGNCSASVSNEIEVLEKADASWTIPESPCAGESITLSPSGTPGGVWSGTGVTDLGNGTASFSSKSAGTYDVTYTAGTGNCSATLTQQIEVTPVPDASWSPPIEPLCAGEAITLEPLGEPGGMWSGQGVTDLGNGTASFVQNKPGTFAVTYTVTSGNCTASLVQDITVIDLADPSWTLPSTLCSGNTYVLTADGTPGGVWTGQGIEDQGNGTAIFTADEAGAFSVTYTAGLGQCQASLTQDMIVSQTPDASWSVPPNGLCQGDLFDLIPNGSTGGTWSGPGVTDNGDGTGTFMQTEAGQYSITYSVTKGACSNASTQTINVVDQPDASWTPPTNLCAGDAVTLTPSGDMGGTWTGIGITDLGNGTATFLNSEAGTYSVTYTVGQGTCEASLTQDIEVFPVPDATWTPPSGVCSGELIMLTPDGTTGGTWTGDGVIDQGDGTATFSQKTAGVYTITYTVTAGPCATEVSMNVEVFSEPDASWTVPDGVCTGQEVILTPDGSSGGTWSGNGVMDLGNGTATFVQNDAGTFSITYAVGTGPCFVELTQDIIVESAGDPSWTPPGEIICPGQVLDLFAPEGSWSGTGVTDFGGGLGEFQSPESGIFAITLTVGSGDCTASESHDIEVGDVDPPIIDIPATDVTTPCDGTGNQTELNDWLDSNGGAEATDLCSGQVTWEHDFTDFIFDCGMAGITTVIFTATDDAGNTSTTVGVFEIQDTDPPEFDGVPDNITVSCDAVPPPDPVNAFDICSGDAEVVFDEIPPGTDCPYVIVRTWTATDDCGNTSMIQQTITATDDIPPEALSIPHDTVIICTGNPEECIPPPEPPFYTDNCDPEPEAILTEEIQPIPEGLQVIRCWTAIDDCGNMSEPICHQIIIIINIPNGTNLQVPDNLLLTLQPAVPNLYTEVLAPIFNPSNADWQDPGLITTLGSLSAGGVSFREDLALQLNASYPMGRGVLLIIDATRRSGGLTIPFTNGSNTVLMSGRLGQQIYSGGLQFFPDARLLFYFKTQWHLERLLMSDLQLAIAGKHLLSGSEIEALSLTPSLGIGMQFPVNTAGTFDILLNYGAPHFSGLFAALKINLTSLLAPPSTNIK